MPARAAWLASIGASFGAIGKSGLLRPVAPGPALRAVAALRRTGIGLGAVYALNAALRPDETACLDDAGGATFAQMEGRAVAVAAGLAELGISPGSTVALLCRNHSGFLVGMVALAKLGADTVYLNTGFAGPQLAAVAAAEGIDAVIVDEDLAGLTAGLDSAVTVVLTATRPAAGSTRVTPAGLAQVGSAGPAKVGPVASLGAATAPEAARYPTLEAMFEAPAPAAAIPGRPGRAGRQVLLTSGTTGAPRGAGRGTPGSPAPLLGLLARIPFRRGDTTVMAAPMFHAWGLANTGLALALGATLILTGRFDPDDTLRRIDATRAAVLVAVPVMLQRILELPVDTLRRYDLSSLRVVAVSGSALPGGLATRWMDVVGDNLYNLYGSTEVGWVSVAGPADLRAAPGTAGRLLPGVAVDFVDDRGRRVDRGTPGRIMVRSSLTFDGYTNGSTKEVLDGAMSSGDVGHLDDGLLFVDGRDDDMIVSGGENVFPREVEDLIAEYPGVADASVVGVADDDFGQRLEAWVVLRPGSSVDAEELIAVVRSRLARYKVPRRVHFVAELPRTTTGKVLRRALSGSGQ